MNTGIRRTPKERGIDAPVLPVDIDEQVRMLKKEPEWKDGDRDGITLVKYPHMRVVLVALKRGTRMREHRIQGPISLFVVSGRINFVVGTSEHHVGAKAMVNLRTSIVHDIRAERNAVVLLTIMNL